MVRSPIGSRVFLFTMRPASISPNPPFRLIAERRCRVDSFPNLVGVEHARLFHFLVEFKLGALSIPAEAKRNSHFSLLGLPGYINSVEAVSSLCRNPRVCFLTSFLIWVTTLPDFRLRASC